VKDFSGYARFGHLVLLVDTYTILQVGQLLDHGKVEEGSYWTIVRDMRMIQGFSEPQRCMIPELVAANKRHKPMPRHHCEYFFNKASYAALSQMEWYVKNKGILHRDVNTANVLFDHTLQDAELVDWGSWTDVTVRAKPVLFLPVIRETDPSFL
jgi:serine/threonine protein kinase